MIKEVMYAFYMSLKKPSGSHTENTFSIWRSRNHNVRMNLNGNKLANVRRDIMNNKRLTDVELREIKEKVIADVKDIDTGYVGIRDRMLVIGMRVLVVQFVQMQILE